MRAVRAQRLGAAAALFVVAATAGCATTDPTIISPADDGVTSSTPPAAMSFEARYLATVATMVEGTEYEGLPEADPQGFLASADLMCELLDDGNSPDEVLRRYLEELAAARGAESEDDAVLAGTLLGASVETFCPEYSDEFGS